MEDLGGAPCSKELVQRIEREGVGKGVDEDGALVGLSRPGQLYQAELGVIGSLAQESVSTVT